MPYSGGSDWLSKEPHQTICNLAVLGSGPAVVTCLICS